jgi:hypothetical protein
MTTPAPGAPFRHTLGTNVFSGRVVRDGVHESFVEVFAHPTGVDSVLDVDTDAPPLVLAKSTVEADAAGAFTATVRLSFYDTY